MVRGVLSHTGGAAEPEPDVVTSRWSDSLNELRPEAHLLLVLSHVHRVDETHLKTLNPSHSVLEMDEDVGANRGGTFRIPIASTVPFHVDMATIVRRITQWFFLLRDRHFDREHGGLKFSAGEERFSREENAFRDSSTQRDEWSSENPKTARWRLVLRERLELPARQFGQLLKTTWTMSDVLLQNQVVRTTRTTGAGSGDEMLMMMLCENENSSNPPTTAAGRVAEPERVSCDEAADLERYLASGKFDISALTLMFQAWQIRLLRTMLRNAFFTAMTEVWTSFFLPVQQKTRFGQSIKAVVDVVHGHWRRQTGPIYDMSSTGDDDRQTDGSPPNSFLGHETSSRTEEVLIWSDIF